MAKEQSKRQEIINDIKTILGDGMVDVELDPKHYEQGIDLAVDKFRAKSDNSTEEAYIFLEIQADVNEYTLSIVFQSTFLKYQHDDVDFPWTC